MTTELAAHWPRLLDAIAFAVVVVLLSLGYLWREVGRAPLADTPDEQAEAAPLEAEQ